MKRSICIKRGISFHGLPPKKDDWRELKVQIQLPKQNHGCHVCSDHPEKNYELLQK